MICVTFFATCGIPYNPVNNSKTSNELILYLQYVNACQNAGIFTE